ncbi:MAG: dUTP diphosphatase [Candidatus Melainabacteria bacterium]|nr:dUTP diphosphatase [Candidatus Melainabacteria bacterium]
MSGKIEILKVSPEAVLPTRAHPDDAGLDLYNLDDVHLEPGMGKTVKTGIALALPAGHVGLVADRSSLGKKGIKTAGGVIDAGYRGEIHIVLWNLSPEAVQLKRGERIAQLLILPIATPAVQEVSTLDETLRGTKGFGSSGK